MKGILIGLVIMVGSIMMMFCFAYLAFSEAGVEAVIVTTCFSLFLSSFCFGVYQVALEIKDENNGV